MNRVQILSPVAAFLVVQAPAAAQLRVDFNSTNQDGGPHPTVGYESYDAAHEVATDFVPQTFMADFGNGPVAVTVTPAWPSTTSNQVMQMIDRTPGFDSNWVGDDPDLLTDWIGCDSRLAVGGNGDWDRVNGMPTYMTLTLSGLPAGQYQWLSFHHDTEHIWSDFQVEVSTDGGATYGAPIDKEMTNSTTGGNPANPNPSTGAAAPLPADLSSAFTTALDATGADVVLRFAPYDDGAATGVHKQLFGMNGFVLEGPGVPGVKYCVANPNSTGGSAGITASGTVSLASADLVLHASGVPDQPGLFVYGSNQIQVPWGNSFVCVSGGGFILPPLFPTQNQASLPMAAANVPAGTFLAGGTWHFQYIYRDPAGGGAQFSSSDGLSVTFLP